MISIDSVRKKIDSAFESERLKEVLVSVNSPGGSPVQCDLITSYLHMKAAKTKVPVTVFVEASQPAAAIGLRARAMKCLPTSPPSLDHSGSFMPV